jgi:ATP-dependent RNA helicase DHX37/DHR1
MIIVDFEFREGKMSNGELVTPLKMIIMSATLRVEDFVSNSTLFPIPPPVVSVDSRQYSVTVHFNKRTPENYIDEAFKKVCKIHRKLPPGGVLVFMTGQQEIETLCYRLRKKFPLNRAKINNKSKANDLKKESKESKDSKEAEEKHEKVKPEEALIEGEEDSDSEDEDSDGDEAEGVGPMCVLPLYSALSTASQLKVFQPPPEGVY